MSLQPINVNTADLFLGKKVTSLKTDYASGVSSITVYSIAKLAINQVLCIGEYGSQGSEIIKTHAATAPTGFAVTLAANLAKPHPKDTPVYLLAFDQIGYYHADTLTGAKSLMGSLTTINPELQTLTYEDTSNTSGYYFTRYYNTISTVYSDYSDGVPYSGMPDNTFGYALDNAMNELGAKFSDNLTYGMCLGFGRQMLRLVRGKLKKWSKYQKYDEPIGTMSQGVRSFAMPTDCYDKNSDRSVLNLRIAGGLPMTYIDRSEYLQATQDVVYTEVATLGVVGGTSLVLDDTSDLEDSGSIDIFVSGTKYTVVYTANTRSTNTLTTEALTYAFPVNSPVWQNIEEGDPEFFNVSDGYVYPWPMIDSEYEGRNLIMDYNTDIETIDSDMDVISGVKFDMLQPYLKYKIRAVTENNGKEDLKDPSYLEFRELLNDSIKNDGSAEIVSFRPRSKAIYGGRSHDNRR